MALITGTTVSTDVAPAISIDLVNELHNSYRALADILGISEHAAYRRLRGFAGWKLHETIHLCQYFGINDTAWLFSRCDTHCDTYTTKFPENQDGGDCHLQNL
jgi:hypothetical protein